MKLVVGLGNPGEEYAYNRHNVGFMVIDRLVKNLKVSPHVEKELDALVFYHHSSGTIFARPQTFMNNSGEAVKKLIDNWKLEIENLYVVHDDLDLPLGTWKIQHQKGPKIHKGLLSIEQQIGTKNFWRIRIGVDNRKPEPFDEVYPGRSRGAQGKIPGEKYVLQNFEKREIETIEAVIKEVVEKILSISNEQ